jgi:hypothetical protein
LTASRTPSHEPGTRVMKVAIGTTYRPAAGWPGSCSQMSRRRLAWRPSGPEA